MSAPGAGRVRSCAEANCLLGAEEGGTLCGFHAASGRVSSPAEAIKTALAEKVGGACDCAECVKSVLDALHEAGYVLLRMGNLPPDLKVTFEDEEPTDV